MVMLECFPHGRGPWEPHPARRVVVQSVREVQMMGAGFGTRIRQESGTGRGSRYSSIGYGEENWSPGGMSIRVLVLGAYEGQSDLSNRRMMSVEKGRSLRR